MFELNWFEMLFLLVAAHFLADFPLQGQFMADAKNHTNKNPQDIWKIMLFGHGMIHAGFVLIITGYWVFAVYELIAHMYIDYRKCSMRITFMADQKMHLACKVFYVIAIGIIEFLINS